MKDHFTIHDIAKLMNVSPSTVSRALNDHPRISTETREAIKSFAKEKGYRPNNLASSLRKGTSMTIGVIVPRINRHFFSSAIGSMEEILNNAGYNIMICQTNEDHKKEIDSIRTLINTRVDTLFISPAIGSKNSSHLKEIIEKGIKVFMFDRVDESLSVPWVKIDDYAGAFNAVCHLIDQGYRHIVHFAGPAHLNIYADRYKGYVDALSSNNIQIDTRFVVPETLTMEQGSAAFHFLRSNVKHADAIFSSSDLSALGAFLAARELNISIPEEFGIAGFANEPFTGFIQPGITTVDQKPSEMGKIMAGMFLNNPFLPEILHETIMPQLIVRGSTLRKNINN